jgi:hypothetical protein
MIWFRGNVDAIKRTFLTTAARGGGGREAGTNYWGPPFWNGVRGTWICCICSVILCGGTICRLYKSDLSHQTQLTVHLRVINADLVSIIWACLPMLGGPKNFFRRGLNLLSATLVSDRGRNRIWNLQPTASTTTYWANPVHSINYAPYIKK